jgi:hypothetical protein
MRLLKVVDPHSSIESLKAEVQVKLEKLNKRKPSDARDEAIFKLEDLAEDLGLNEDRNECPF